MARVAGIAKAAEHATETFPLIDKLASCLSLSPAEIEFLRDLHGRKRRFGRYRDIIAQGRPYRNVFILCSGFVCCYKILPDGKRQVLNLGLPGDLIGLPACCFENAVNAARSLTEVVAATVPFQTLYDLFVRFRRVAVALFWVSAREAAISEEHLVNVGRRSAYERLAHLILELLVRLRDVGLANELSVISSADPGADRRRPGPQRSACQPVAAIIAGRRTDHHRRTSPDRDRPRVADAACRFRKGLFGSELDPGLP